MPRIGGAFPFPLANVAEGGSRLSLASGGTFYLPSNQYLVAVDASSAIEFFDGQQQTWVRAVSGAGGYADLTSDGFNYRVRNITGSVSSLAVTAGSGMQNGIGPAQTGVTLSFAAPGTAGYPSATAYAIIGGAVAVPTITQAGTGYLVPPVLVIDPPPPGGIQATAHAVLAAVGGGIGTVVIDNPGAGYVSSPNFYIIPQPSQYQGGTQGGVAAGAIPAPGTVNPLNAVPGNQNTTPGLTGALLTPAALTGSGTMTGAVIINAGGGYIVAAPAVTVGGGAGGAAVAATVAVTTLAVANIILQPRVQS